MDDKIRNEIALMRYTIIAPLISDTPPQDFSKTDFFQSASTKSYLDPTGRPVRFSDGTIERWYYNYKKDELTGIIITLQITMVIFQEFRRDLFASSSLVDIKYDIFFCCHSC